MSNGWDDVKKGGGSGEFTEIKEGRPVTIHLLTDIVKIKELHWNAKKEFKECTKDGCLFCKDSGSWNAAKTTFSTSVYNFTTKRQEFLEKGYSIFKTIKETREAYNSDLSNVDFRISAEGSGIETKYSVIPVVPTKFKPEMILEEPEAEHNPF